ncbi:hypothetical protein E2C01_056955 [Portunus trituberculatus]|uniref:Insertion element IS150 protein InsJ-like helix-turn-helix domain-containing protein n=1 Tax=Portunus trituberculatus TaxID=210409 RepID=A0A5B7H207_PORTR|nr:hypothetical protein [Portunus trituberculatus]
MICFLSQHLPVVHALAFEFSFIPPLTAPFCGCVSLPLCLVTTYCIMGPRKLISKAQISVICALVRGNKSYQEIATNNGIALRTVQHWTKIYREGGRDALPPPYKPEGRKRSVSYITLNIIQRQLEANLHIHNKELQARNPLCWLG